MKRKIVSVLLVAAMIFSLAACGGTEDKQGEPSDTENEEGDPSVNEEGTAGGDVTFPLDEKMTYTAFSVLHASTYDLDDSLPMQVLQEECNIDIEFQSVMSAELSEKRNLLLNSGEYPELLIKSGITTSEMSDYGRQGILIPLEDLIQEYMPNLTAWLDDNDAWQWITSSDGHVYGLPCYELAITDWIPYWINMKWIENLGLEEPTNLDELYEVLKAFKEEDANGNGDPDDEIPLAFNGMPDFLFQYLGEAVDSRTYCYVNDGQLTFAPVSDIYHTYLEFFAKLYAEGLILDTCFTITGEELTAMGTANDVIGSNPAAGIFLTVGRDRDEDYKILTPFEKGKYSIGNGISTGVFCVTDACENPGPALAMFDTFYSQEGGTLATMGVEGKTYTINEDGDWEWIVGGEYGDTVDEVRGNGTIQGTTAGPYISPDIWWNNMSPKTDPDEVYLNKERVRTAEYGVSVLPNMFYSQEDEDIVSTLFTDIRTYCEEYTVQVITGEKDLESTWDEYVSTIEQMGLSELMDAYQRTYENSLEMLQ